MSKTPPLDPAPADRPDDARRASPPGTLGELLYADESRRPALEEEWVALVRSIATADPRALHALYERAHRTVFTLTLRITRSPQLAEEVTVDVFHDVWRRASGYDASGGSVLGWILNQARSRAIDRMRFENRKKRVDPQTDRGLQVSEAHPEHLLELQQQALHLREALNVLSADERMAIETAYFQELTYPEVAMRLNQPLGTIKTRIRSALAKLRQTLAPGSASP